MIEANGESTGETLHRMFDCCAGVVIHEEVELISIWNGSQTVNIYTFEGDNVDVWMCDGMDRQGFQSLAIEHMTFKEDDDGLLT